MSICSLGAWHKQLNKAAMQRKEIYILHVDDNKDDLTIFKYNLTSLDKNIELKWAFSGESALELLKREEFDCIISDYEMSPGMNGIDLLKKVRIENPDIPFIFFTGQGNEEIAAEAFRTGVNDYYTKDYSPLYFHRILNSVKQSILNYKKHQERELIQRTLSESEERYKRLVEMNPKAIVVHRNSEIIYMNKAALYILGNDHDPDHMIGKDILDLIHPDHRSTAKARISQSMKGAILSDSAVYPAAFGSKGETIVEVTSIPIFYESNPAVLSVLDNITERVKAEETIRNLNSLLLAIRNVNNIINHENDFKTIVMKTTEMLAKVRDYIEVYFALRNEETGLIEPVSKAGSKSIGNKWFVDDLGRGNAPKCVKKTVEQGDINIFAGEVSSCKKCGFNRQECKNPHILVPFRIKGKTAGLFYITSKEKHLIDKEEIELLKNIVGDLEFAYGKYETERALKTSEEKYRTYFNLSPDVMSISTIKDGIFKDVNEIFCTKSGYERSEIIGRKSEEIGIWINKDDRKNIIEEVNKKGFIRNKNAFIRIKRGDKYPVLISASPIEYQGSVHLLSTIHDVSETHKDLMTLSYKEERFRSIFNNTYDAIIIGDSHGKITEANDIAISMLGYSAEELCAIKIQDIKTEAKKTKTIDILKGTLRLGKARFDTVLITKEGCRKEVEVTGTLFTFQEETFFQVFIRDISAERKAESFNQRMNTYLQALADINYKLLISDKTEESMNEILAMVGQSSEVSRCYLMKNEPVGNKILSSIQAEWTEKGIKRKTGDPRYSRLEVDPGHFENVDALVKGNAAAENSDQMPLNISSTMKDYDVKSQVMIPIIYENDFKGVLGLDDCKNERKWEKEELALLKAAAGSIGSSLRQKEIKQELEDTGLLMKQFINSTSDCFELKDIDGRFIMVNNAAAACYGASPDEMTGKTDNDYLSKETFQIFEKEFNWVVKNRRSKEFLFFNNDFTEPKVYHTLIFPVSNPISNAVLIGSIKRDITERQRDEEKIRKINAELDEFVHTVSHDLKTPLQSMTGYLEMLKSLEGKEREEVRKKAFTQGKMMEGFITQLLKLSRLGRSIDSFICFDSSLIVREVFELFKVNYPNVIMQIKGNLPIVCGDVNRIREVFQNLIANALENSDPAKTRPVITISCTQEDKRSIFSIKDNGKGMDENTRKRLFVLGYTTSTDKTQRYGIGLNIVKRIIEAHDGEVWVESELKIGSTFYFSLPRWSSV